MEQHPQGRLTQMVRGRHFELQALSTCTPKMLKMPQKTVISEVCLAEIFIEIGQYGKSPDFVICNYLLKIYRSRCDHLHFLFSLLNVCKIVTVISEKFLIKE